MQRLWECIMLINSIKCIILHTLIKYTFILKNYNIFKKYQWYRRRNRIQTSRSLFLQLFISFQLLKRFFIIWKWYC